MIKNLEFFIAFRFIKYRLIRTLIIVFAIAVGIAVQFFVAIIIDSTQANLIKRTLGLSPHITIKPYDNEKINDKIKNPENILKNIDNNFDINNFKKVIYLVEGSVKAYNFKNKNDLNVRFVGIENVIGEDFYGISENLIKGNDVIKNPQEVIVGNNIYEKLGLDIGDTISLKKNTNKDEYEGFRVIGIFKSGNQVLDNYVFGERAKVQDFLGYKRDEYSSLYFQIYNVFDSDKIKKILEQNFNFPYELSEWKESNKQLLNGLSAQSQSSFFIQFFILISIGISILSILNMKVVEKYKEIGVLKAIGMNNSNISKIFIYMSFIIGFLGVFIGIVFTFLILSLFINLTKNEQGVPLFNLVIKTEYFILSMLFNLFVVIFAGYISSRKAIKYEPSKIIIGN